MRIPIVSFVLIIFTLLILFSCPVLSADQKRLLEDHESIFNVIYENDIFAGKDRNYTNGVRLSWISSEAEAPHWVNDIAHLLPLYDEGAKNRMSIALGQSIFTPTDITQKAPSSDEQPYAGWLYGSVGVVSDTGKTLDNIVLTLGIVGPLSYAEESQKIIHHMIGSPQPQGWSNQLKNEPGIIFTYERKWSALYDISPFGVQTDMTPHAGINLGNITTDAELGATFRLGYDLPSDYGPPRIRPSLPGSDFFIPTEHLGAYLFTTIGERAVARNIFLDGNTFESSPHVDKENFISSLQLGGVITYGDARISYTHVFMTKEYKTQQTKPQFGALTVSYRF